VPSLSLKYIRSLPIDQALLKQIDRLGYARGAQRLFKTQTPELLRQLTTVARIESTESSTRIEGVSAPRDRIEGIVLRDAVPTNRSESEIAGYRDALRMIHENAEHMRFSESQVLQIHDLLYRYLPTPGGHYKATQNDIAETDANGEIIRVRFSPTSPVQTPGAMRNLVEDYALAVDQDALPSALLIGLAVLDLLCIHPFPDGNGRTARLLTLLLLYHHDFEVGRYVSLERIIEQTRDGYYEALERSSTGWHSDAHDARPWLDYFLGMLIAAYDEFEQRIDAVRRGKGGTKTEMVRSAVARRLAPFAIGEIQRELPGISRDLIRSVLRTLRSEGLVTLEGQGRGARYVPSRHAEPGDGTGT